MEWRQSEILDLIRLYKRHECLWDYRDSDYKNLTLRNKSWEKLASRFGKKPDEVKKKIKNLRNSYLCEKKKVNKLNKLKVPYEPHLFYYNLMSFLDQVQLSRIISEKGDHQAAAILHSRPSEVEQTHSKNSDKELESHDEQDEEDDENMEEINSTIPSRRSSSNESLESLPHIVKHESNSPAIIPYKRSSTQIAPYKSIKNEPAVQSTKQSKQKKTEMRRLPNKEDTFCAMICSELMLLKSDETYDNVTTEIFIALRNAKSTDRKMCDS